ncbi:MAG TPA: polysaccharide biosynthesis/export family protein [Bryobacteraceae bacterium]|nr:polysaccharide biosynthesis/export family protein [Bryobacteraceae bacterium]
MLHRFIGCVALLTFGLLLIAQNSQDSAIKNGETLKITVYREPDLSRTITVKSDGNLYFPVIGNIPAEGLTLSQFSRALQMALTSIVNNPLVTTERAEPAK